MIETTVPGKLLCVNDDDDDNNGVPDKDQEPPPTVDDDLVRIVMEVHPNDPKGKWRLQYDASTVQVYEDNRVTIVPSGQDFNLPMMPNPKNFWVEGISPIAGTVFTLDVDIDGDGTFDCADSVAATVFRAELNVVTSGTNPVPTNPTMVAPMTSLWLDTGVLFWNANSFELTTLQPNIDSLVRTPVCGGV